MLDLLVPSSLSKRYGFLSLSLPPSAREWNIFRCDKIVSRRRRQFELFPSRSGSIITIIMIVVSIVDMIFRKTECILQESSLVANIYFYQIIW